MSVRMYKQYKSQKNQKTEKEESAVIQVWSEEEKEKDDVIRLLVEEFGKTRTGLPLIAEQIIINDHVRLFKCLSDKILGDDASAVVDSKSLQVAIGK